jgi:ribosomal protein L18E
MENVECEVKFLSANDIKENSLKQEESYKVFLSKERQAEIKKLMFSALEDPRAKYEKVDMDDLENYWKNKHGC